MPTSRPGTRWPAERPAAARAGVAVVLKSLLLPPGLLLWPLAAGLILLAFAPGAGVALTAAGAVMLYVGSTPATARWLARRLETTPPVAADPPAEPAAGAIVVLGGELRCPAPEYGGDTLAPTTLERVRYGAVLHRATGLPVLVTGGRPPGCQSSEAALMAGVLERELGVETCWREEHSRTTWENAQQAAAVLGERGIGRILLVTHAMHMQRAARAFRRAGLEVVSAPMGFTAGHLYQRGAAAWLPSATAQHLIADLAYEWLGGLHYRLRSRSSAT
ncbi:MAG TPA: YdcF family protein [Gammaproteobacteria bacterium]|nr:YdcF family protein [Gammaproteobacteria bacterium]